LGIHGIQPILPNLSVNNWTCPRLFPRGAWHEIWGPTLAEVPLTWLFSTGAADKAKHHMLEAADPFSMEHFMGQVWQVHCKLRGWQAAPVR